MTNPTAQSITYSTDFSELAHDSADYPAGWQGWHVALQLDRTEFSILPSSSDARLERSGTATDTMGGIWNYDGKIGFLSTGAKDLTLALAIGSRGFADISVTYDMMTIRNPYGTAGNNRINEVMLQYRTSTTGTFTNLIGVEYRNNTSRQTDRATDPQNLQTKSVTLPPGCSNRDVVQLRWISREVSCGGFRPSFAVDNVSITGAPLATYTITAQAGEGGTITPDGAVAVNAGESCEFTIAVNPGYHVSDVLIDGASIGPVEAYSFPDVDSDHTIEATFAVSTYTITAQAGEGGTITPDGAVAVNAGESCEFTIAVNPGYHVSDVLIDGASIGPVEAYSFPDVDSDHTIEAQFEQDQ